MSEPVAGFGHVDWRERAHHWHREHDAAAKDRDALRAERDALRAELARERARCDDLTALNLGHIRDLRAETELRIKFEQRAEAAGERAEVLHHLLLAIQREREALLARGLPAEQERASTLDWIWQLAGDLARARARGPL